MLKKIKTMCAKFNPVPPIIAAYIRWRDTEIYFRFTRDDMDNEMMYEFVLVPIESNVFSMHISKIDFTNRRIFLVQRSITADDFEILRPKLTKL